MFAGNNSPLWSVVRKPAGINYVPAWKQRFNKRKIKKVNKGLKPTLPPEIEAATSSVGLDKEIMLQNAVQSMATAQTTPVQSAPQIVNQSAPMVDENYEAKESYEVKSNMNVERPYYDESNIPAQEGTPMSEDFKQADSYDMYEPTVEALENDFGAYGGYDGVFDTAKESVKNLVVEKGQAYLDKIRGVKTGTGTTGTMQKTDTGMPVWAGVAIGAVAVGGLLYLLNTKKRR